MSTRTAHTRPSAPVRLLALAAATALAAPVFAVQPPRVVQLNDQPCPGLGPTITFWSMSDTMITPSGRAYFNGDLVGPGILADDTATCVETSMISKAMVIHKNAQAPALPAGVTCSYVYRPVINDLNQLCIEADLTGTGITAANNRAIYGGTVFAPSVLARTGSQAAGLPAGITYSNLLEVGMNHVGKYIFSSELAGGTNPFAIFTGLPGNILPIMRYGDQAVGLPAGVVYGGLIYYSPDVNDGGEAGFSSHLSGAGVIAGANDSAAWFGHPGALSLIARTGNAAPGLAAGVLYGDILDHPRINNGNQIALTTKLQGVGVNGNNDTAVFFGAAGALSPLVREGSPLPEQPAGVNIGEIEYAMPNDNGLTAISADVFGLGVVPASNHAWLAARSGGLVTTIFRNGDPAPGQPAGVTYGSPWVTSMKLSNTNLVAYMTNLAGPGVTPQTMSALYAGTPGNPGPVVRGGDTLEVAPGDVRTVYTVTLAGGYSKGGSAPTAFSSTNQLAFTVYFTNNTSAAMVATICPADFNHSKVVSVQDIFDFLAAYFANDIRADVNGSLTVSVQDIFDFLARYFAGC
jgi:hypothetical protein